MLLISGKKNILRPYIKISPQAFIDNLGSRGTSLFLSAFTSCLHIGNKKVIIT